MQQRHAFWQCRGARGVEQTGNVVSLHTRRHSSDDADINAFSTSHEIAIRHHAGRAIVSAHQAHECWQAASLAPRLFKQCAKIASAKHRLDSEQLHLRMLQLVGEFVRGRPGIESDCNCTQAHGRKIQHQPFDAIAHQNTDPIPGLNAGRLQSACGAIYFFSELGIGPSLLASNDGKMGRVARHNFGEQGGYCTAVRFVHVVSINRNLCCADPLGRLVAVMR